MDSRILKTAATITALALLMATAVGAVDIHQSVSGNFLDTSIDTNEDGMAGNIVMGDATGDGAGAFRGFWEVAFTDPTGACDAEEIEGVFVAYSMTRSFADGDLVFSELVDGTACLDPVGGTASVVINAAITGGTGAFETVSGEYTLEYESVVLLPDATGGIAHGAFVGTVDGTVDD